MAWVDQHSVPKRLRSEIFDAFERDWSVEVPSNEDPLILLSRGSVQLQFTIGSSFPFDAPVVHHRSQDRWRVLCLPPNAWQPIQRLHAYAERIVQHHALLKSIRAGIRSL